MRKIILCIALAIFAFNNGNAQDVKFGLKAGLNLASINGDDTDNLDSRTAFHVGAVVDIPVSEKFSIQPELLYSAQGAKYSESDGYDGKFKLDYFNVPVMAKVEVADGFCLEAGPQVGFLLSAKDEYESPGDSGEEDIKDFVKGTDFGINFGVSYSMETGLNFGVRYNLGISDINDDSDYSGKNQNGVFQFSVGFMF